MKVLLSCASFLPSYGGPARSVSRLGRALAEAGLEVALWAPDGSTRTSPLCSPIENLAMLDGPPEAAVSCFGRPDVWHDNGIWLAHNHAIASLSKRQRLARVVSLRGMLEPAALRHRAWKKTLAWPLYQRRDLMTANRLHATSHQEAAHIEARGLGPGIGVIPNGADLPPLIDGGLKPSARTALFLGRIHPIKGLPMLLEAWARVRPQGWTLKIAGPDETGGLADLKRTVEGRKLGGAVEFLGSVEGETKEALYRSADLFVLPSYSENFGMAAAEALSYGVPVLTTHGTPWKVLSERACGWWVAPEAGAIEQALRQATGLDRAELERMGARGRALMAEDFGWDQIAGRFAALYEAAASVV